MYFNFWRPLQTRFVLHSLADFAETPRISAPIPNVRLMTNRDGGGEVSRKGVNEKPAEIKWYLWTIYASVPTVRDRGSGSPHAATRSRTVRLIGNRGPSLHPRARVCVCATVCDACWQIPSALELGHSFGRYFFVYCAADTKFETKSSFAGGQSSTLQFCLCVCVCGLEFMLYLVSRSLPSPAQFAVH